MAHHHHDLRMVLHHILDQEFAILDFLIILAAALLLEDHLSFPKERNLEK